MMKVQFGENNGRMTLQVCGRLTKGWVEELENCWRSAAEKNPGRHFFVDLRGVTFIDESGESLLRIMHRDGASFVAGGLLVQEVVNQITGGSK
jgi:anti-anti-sigma regulatory factor